MSTLSFEGTQAITWTLNAIAIVLTAGRLYIRGKMIGSFFWDDATHCLALLFSIAQIALYSGAKSLVASITRFEKGETDTLPNFKLYLQLNVAVVFMFFLALWAVKLTFMIFYRNLFKVSRNFMIGWRAVLIYVFLTFWVCIGISLAQCDGKASELLNLAVCNSSSSIKWQTKIFKISFAMNMSSDVAIMILPLAMLPGLQMRKSQKLGVAGIFCLSLVIVALEIVRIVESLKGSGTSLNTLWTNMETSIAVIVSCMPTYNTLISHRKKHAIRDNTSAYNKLAASKRTARAVASSKSLANSSETHCDYAVTNGSRDGASQNIAMEHLESYARV